MKHDVTDALEEIDSMLPGAAVYGGFLRDAYLGLPYNDVDIAVQTGTHNLRKLGFEIQDLEGFNDYDHDHIAGVWRRGELNVIEFSMNVSARSMNDYVDLGICKIAWSMWDGLVIDPRFLDDVNNKTLRIFRTGWGEEGVAKHVARMQLKFPDYEVIGP